MHLLHAQRLANHASAVLYAGAEAEATGCSAVERTVTGIVEASPIASARIVRDARRDGGVASARIAKCARHHCVALERRVV